MAADGYFLTEADKAFLARLREMVERNGEEAVLSVIRNQPSAELPSTTECYVARTPQGGIPALTPGTPPELRTRARDGVSIFHNTDDRPGRALCDIWRVVQVEDPPRRELRPVPMLAQWVYNPSLTPIPENAWVPVVRDKFGGWWPAAAGGEQGTRPVQVIDGPYDGYYVGIIDTRDENGATPLERWVTTWVYVAVVGYNDEALEIGKRYKASKTSDHPSWGLPVYAVQPGGGGSPSAFSGALVGVANQPLLPGQENVLTLQGGPPGLTGYDTDGYLQGNTLRIAAAGYYQFGAELSFPIAGAGTNIILQLRVVGIALTYANSMLSVSSVYPGYLQLHGVYRHVSAEEKFFELVAGHNSGSFIQATGSSFWVTKTS